MTHGTQRSTKTVALVGNPNTGKSTLFNALVGVRQRVGNYPGVTVEKKVGHVEHDGQRLAIVDLPGTYSLAPRSLDEMVAVDLLLGRQKDMPTCDAVICIVDASNLERNLYLVNQVLELGLPTVLALNMIDVAKERGIKLDVDQLQSRLKIPVVPLQATKRVGIPQLKSALVEAMDRAVSPQESPFPEAFRNELAKLEKQLNAANGDGAKASSNGLPRYLVERLLLDTSGYLSQSGVIPGNHHAWLDEELPAARARLSAAGCPIPAIEAISRYQWVSRILDGIHTRPSEREVTWSDKIDRLLTHRLWGTLTFALVMFALFSSIFIFAEPLMGMIDSGAGWLSKLVENKMAEGALRSLIVQGVLGGVGGVIVFLPQILLLFMFIAVLEDCGYMARAAYLMDKLMVRVGLSGKSFIPLLSSFACAIPGIMATRVIENRRDRLTTILVAPLMSCSARLPVYLLLIYAFVPNINVGGFIPLQGLTLFGMYLLGMLAAVVVALVLKRTVLRGSPPPFVMELPPYKFPSPAMVLHRMVDRGWAFLKRAGTLIVAVTIVVWALLYYPHDAARVAESLAQQRSELATKLQHLPQDDPHRQQIEDQLAQFDDPDAMARLEEGEFQRQSYLGQIGHFIEPAVKPLGWDWRVGSAVIASFPAREVVLGTLGVIYNLGEVDLDDEEGQTQLQTQLRNATWDGTDRRVFTLPMALGVMVFFALCAQCAATLIVIKRETNHWGWPIFTFAYMTTLAYIAAFLTYQIGSRL